MFRKSSKLVLFLLVISMILVGCKSDPKTTDQVYKPGEYPVSAQGFGGEVNMLVSFDEKSITGINVLENNETEGIGGNALIELPKKIVDGQTLNVDLITGATITSNAIIEAVSKAVVEAGGKVEDLMVKKTDEKSEEPMEKTTEIVVVGGGGAGLSAAVSAAQKGAKVILIEKTGALGGNTIRAGGPYNAVDPDRQKNVPAADDASMEKIMDLTTKEVKSPEHEKLMKELKSDIEAYKASGATNLFDSKALHKLQTYDGGDYTGELALIEKLIEESLPTSKWMEENGVVWKDEISTVPGGLWPRAHLPQNAAGGDYIKAGQATAEKLGVEIILETEATELIVEDGSVKGIKGLTNRITPITIKADKGVILATGGYAANTELRKKYVPTLVESLPTTNSPAIQGDAIKMVEPVEANLVGMEFIQSLPLGDPASGALNGWMGGSGVEYYYQVNKEGKRFMAEDGRRDVMTAALLSQTDAFSYVITCGNNTLEVNDKNENIWGDDVKKLVEDKVIYKADTIEDLAKQIGIDPAVLKETNDKFNSYVEKGKDDDFGRTLFGIKMDKAPYFASPRVPTVHHTMGGLQINEKCEVLNTKGEIIPGLYAAGEVTGGIHGKNRLGGNALVDIHVFGKTAGETAAANN